MALKFGESSYDHTKRSLSPLYRTTLTWSRCPTRRESLICSNSSGLFAFASTLAPHFAHRDDVLICGEGYLRREATNDAERLAPDCVVTFGVNPEAIIARNGYVISEVGKPPDFVLEVASRSTGKA